MRVAFNVELLSVKPSQKRWQGLMQTYEEIEEQRIGRFKNSK